MLLIILVVSLVTVAGVVMLNEAGRVMLPAVTRTSAIVEAVPVEVLER